MDELKAKIKLALRISHSALDSEIVDMIKSARAEMIRSGVPAEFVYDSGSELVDLAVQTFVLSKMCADDKRSERYEESWKYQLDNIRKSANFYEDL